jgi:hypothetical protein
MSFDIIQSCQKSHKHSPRCMFDNFGQYSDSDVRILGTYWNGRLTFGNRPQA